MYQRIKPAFLLPVAALAIAGCGSSTSSSSAPSSGSPSSTPPPASSSSSSTSALDISSCPTASTVGSAFGGAALPAPTGVAGFTAALPVGASGIGCSYLSSSHDVIINLINDFPSSAFGAAELTVDTLVGRTLAFSPVSGLGTEAVSYTWTSPTYGPAVGVIVQDGTDHVSVYAAGLSASLSQVESLASQLLSS